MAALVLLRFNLNGSFSVDVGTLDAPTGWHVDGLFYIGGIFLSRVIFCGTSRPEKAHVCVYLSKAKPVAVFFCVCLKIMDFFFPPLHIYIFFERVFACTDQTQIGS